jgi:probable O-glycosylation ligase (exosortase A-associated)
MRDVMFAFVWLALVPLNIMSAPVGVVLWVWVTLLTPNALLYGFMAGVPYNKVVGVITIILVLIRREERDAYFDVTLFLLISLGLAATISWSTGMVSSEAATQLYLKLIKAIFLVFTITTVITTRSHIDRIVLATTLSLGFFATFEGLIFLLTAGGHKILGSGALGDNNGLASALLMAIPLLFYLVRYSVLRIVKIGMASVLGLSVVTVLGTYSRGGFIGMMVLALFIIKTSRRRVASVLLVVFAGAALYTIAPATWFQRINTIENASSDASFMGRVVAWKMSLLIALDHPLFGAGPHAIEKQFVWDTYKPDLPRVDFVDTPPPDNSPHAAHSIYFEILGDLGFIGLAIFLTIFVVAFRNCRWLSRICRAHASLFWAADLARMIQISLVIYLTTGTALSNAYYEQVYILLALLSRCRRTARLTLDMEAAGTLGTPNAGRSKLPQHASMGPSV